MLLAEPRSCESVTYEETMSANEPVSEEAKEGSGMVFLLFIFVEGRCEVDMHAKQRACRGQRNLV